MQISCTNWRCHEHSWRCHNTPKLRALWQHFVSCDITMWARTTFNEFWHHSVSSDNTPWALKHSVISGSTPWALTALRELWQHSGELWQHSVISETLRDLGQNSMSVDSSPWALTTLGELWQHPKRTVHALTLVFLWMSTCFVVRARVSFGLTAAVYLLDYSALLTDLLAFVVMLPINFKKMIHNLKHFKSDPNKCWSFLFV